MLIKASIALIAIGTTREVNWNYSGVENHLTNWYVVEKLL